MMVLARWLIRAGLIVLIVSGGMGLASFLGWSGPGARAWGYGAGVGFLLMMVGIQICMRRSSGVRVEPEEKKGDARGHLGRRR